jgi:hypothetical protein
MLSPANASPDTSRCPTHDKGSVWLSGRGADYSTPPPQIPACNFPAPGSCRRSNAIVGLDATDPQARCFRVMLSPALSPEHVLQLAFPSTGRLPSVISAADFSRLCSMLHRYYAAVRLLVCSSTASSPRLPVAARDRQATAGQTRSPRFRRDPSIRDVASDPGRATVPRITAPHMLPSAVATASAPAISRISWLNPTPQTITVYASPWSSPSTTQHSLPGRRYPFPDRTFTGWTAPASPGAPLRLHCEGLSPSTPCRSPGAHWVRSAKSAIGGLKRCRAC